MGIVRKLLTRRMQRKNKFRDNHATREAMAMPSTAGITPDAPLACVDDLDASMFTTGHVWY